MKKGILIVFLSLFLIGCGIYPTPEIIVITVVVSPTLVLATNTPISTPTLAQKLSTPQLIEQAFATGEITEEYRLLYLAYALYEYESLPTQYRGNVGWEGTSVVIELYKAENDPSIICSMSSYVRNEFQRILKLESKSCN